MHVYPHASVHGMHSRMRVYVHACIRVCVYTCMHTHMQWMTMMDSMTETELDETKAMPPSRIIRVAKGSGHYPHEVFELLEQFKLMQTTMQKTMKVACALPTLRPPMSPCRAPRPHRDGAAPAADLECACAWGLTVALVCWCAPREWSRRTRRWARAVWTCITWTRRRWRR